MCGIAGFFRSFALGADERTLRAMGNAILHRGPDAGGEYLDDYVGLAHRRLSILDLSPQGNQPMFSADRRFVIVFNGEIYNFLPLRAELERQGVCFRTKTDTEVILALFEQKGADCLADLNGMFAFAIWDTLKKSLFIARDRIGKKPLYYYHAGGDRFAFASEIKSLLALPGVEKSIEPTALVDYFKYLYIPEPKTIYQNVYKLRPAHYLELHAGGEPRIAEYWDVDFGERTRLTLEQVEGELLTLLQDSTASRMMADVPLGAFLSGGVDSSAVVALMSRASREPVKTCSIGFADKRHDETPFAREVAELFGTDHREYQMRADILQTVALLPKFFDEPFADSSALPTYHVSRLARQSVTVALAGDGGDESFGGYSKYLTELKENLVRRTVPRPLLSLIHAAASPVERHAMGRKARTLAASALSSPAEGYYRTNTFIDDELLEEFLSEPVRRACTGYDPGEHTRRYWEKVAGADHVTSMLYTDLKTYLPGDILVKVDRMSMAHALEVRAPFLDYRVIEFAARLPSNWKIAGGKKKIILQRIFERLLPARVFTRPKQGFTVPLDSWFRGELKNCVEKTLLAQPALANYLSLHVVRRVWDEHQSRRSDHGTLLWSLLMFALWHEEYLGGSHV